MKLPTEHAYLPFLSNVLKYITQALYQPLNPVPSISDFHETIVTSQSERL